MNCSLFSLYFKPHTPLLPSHMENVFIHKHERDLFTEEFFLIGVFCFNLIHHIRVKNESSTLNINFCLKIFRHSYSFVSGYLMQFLIMLSQ